MDDLNLAKLLEQACPRPAYLATTDGGPVLALALHCLMIHAGFELGSEEGKASEKQEARFVPRKDWNGTLVDQWIFTYKNPGKARKFTMHCSLQSRTKRMFVHSCEDNNFANVCVLGLQLDNYVPDAQALRSNKWVAAAVDAGASPAQEPVVRNAAKMEEMLTQYIIVPLLAAAEDEQGSPQDEPDQYPGQEDQKQHMTQAAGATKSGGWFLLGGPGGSLNYLAVAAVTGLALGIVGLVLVRSRGGWLQSQQRRM